MKIEVGKTYLFCIRTSNRDLTFTGLVLTLEEGFISFKDKFNVIKNYNLNSIISFEEVEND